VTRGCCGSEGRDFVRSSIPFKYYSRIWVRGILSYSNSPQMNAIEAYVQFKPEVFQHDGEVLDERTAKFLTNYMREFRDFVVRVLTVLPQD
jgi:chromate reductase